MGHKDFARLQRDIAISKKISHPNLVTIYEVINDLEEDKVYLVSELVKREADKLEMFYKMCQETGLDKIIEEKNSDLDRKLPEEKARKYFRSLIMGLDYLHNTANLIHGNIKPDNILFSSDDTLKITGYNTLHLFEETNNIIDNLDTVTSFMPPEAFADNNIEESHDIWSIGAMLYYFLFGACPFTANKAIDLRRKINTLEYTIPQGTQVSKKAIELIKSCLKKDPSQRPTLEELAKNSWVTKDGTKPLIPGEYDEITIERKDINEAFTFKIPNRVLGLSKVGKSRGSMINPGFTMQALIALQQEGLNEKDNFLWK